MIIVNLLGGLGNQMFQYAAGRALSLARDQPLMLDISSYLSYSMHQGFELDRVFVCPIKVVSCSQRREILGWQHFRIIRRILTRPCFKAIRNDRLIIEPHFNYWQGIHAVPDNCYLSGYWQSEKYFQNFNTKIRSDFTFKAPLSFLNEELSKEIKKVNAISLHVRRGDYQSDPKTNVTHGLCSLDYYYLAIKYIIDRVKMPKFFIFSDDIGWAKVNLKIDFPCFFVEHNKSINSYQDMQLMTLCKHNIIANSSFSWWGAWLNPNNNKIVIAPKRWFADNKDVSDIIPDDWVQM